MRNQPQIAGDDGNFPFDTPLESVFDPKRTLALLEKPTVLLVNSIYKRKDLSG
jgi:hypothetical protein